LFRWGRISETLNPAASDKKVIILTPTDRWGTSIRR
jgi:5S rRNA maturation endonuclease (ribonuclease M5)